MARKIILDRQIKYVTVHSTQPPEVDLSDDLYAEQTDDKDQLKWLVAGSVGGGTMGPPNSPTCLTGLWIVSMSTVGSLTLFKTFLDWKKSGYESESFQNDFKSIVFLEGVFLAQSMLIGKSGIPLFFSTLAIHATFWTPLGMSMIPEIWRDCGNPGSGLGKKLRARLKAPIPKSVSSNFTAVDPKTATEALTATAVLGIVIGGILYIVTLPESITASIALPVITPDKDNQRL